MYKAIIRPILFRLKSDSVHESTIRWARKASASNMLRNLTHLLYDYQSPQLTQQIAGLTFRNPIGLAAGFDKNGTLYPVMEALGFGFVEIGSITAIASAGNPKPRSFRLQADNSLINRMGLNNDGAATVVRRLTDLDITIPLGINIAKTHNPEITGEEALLDYQKSFAIAKSTASYITLNISCPNTKEGKTFENPEILSQLLQKLQIRKDATLPPVFVKFSVDLDKELLTELIDITLSHTISGYVIANTSSRREGLSTPEESLREIGPGGLSGLAIRDRNTELIRQVYKYTSGKKPIIGVGGIFDTQDALEKIRAGADLLQVYTGMVYEGPSIVKNINRGLHKYLKEHDLKYIHQIRTGSG